MGEKSTSIVRRIMILVILLSGWMTVVVISLPYQHSVEARRRNHNRVATKALKPEEMGAPAGPYPIVPDRIEVIEYSPSENKGPRDASTLARSANLSTPLTDPEDFSSSRRFNVKIESGRVQEIQQALLKKGFYSGAISGAYNEETIQAMKRFQASVKIPVTGYPTAHALNRLGLSR